MTVELEKPITLHKGDGSVRVFSFFWKAMNADTVKGSINGYEISDVTGALNPNQDEQPGGTLTFNSTIPAAGADIAIFRRTKSGQNTKFVESGRFPAKASETALDKLTMLVQEMGLSLDATIRVPLYEGGLIDLPPSFLRRRKVLGFDDNGMPYMVDPIGGGLTSNNVEHQPSSLPQSTVGAELRRQEAVDAQLSQDIQQNAQGITQNGQDIFAIDQRVSQIEGYDLNTRVTQNGQDISDLAIADAFNAKIHTSYNGAVYVPTGSEAQKPAGDQTTAMLRYTLGKGFEGYNPETDEYGGIGGGGLLSPILPSSYPHTADKATNITVDVSDGISKVIDIPLDWVTGDFISVTMTGWLGDPSVTVRMGVDPTQEWDHPEMSTGDSLVLVRNQSCTIQKLANGKLKVVDAVGESQSVAKSGETILYEGAPLSGDINLAESIFNFDTIRVCMQGVTTYTAFSTCSPEDLLNTETTTTALTGHFFDSTNNFYGRVIPAYSTSTKLNISTAATGAASPAGVFKVVGIKY